MIKCWGLSSQQRATQLNTNMLDMLNERTSLRRMVNTPAVSFFVEVFSHCEKKSAILWLHPHVFPHREKQTLTSVILVTMSRLQLEKYKEGETWTTGNNFKKQQHCVYNFLP